MNTNIYTANNSLIQLTLNSESENKTAILTIEGRYRIHDLDANNLEDLGKVCLEYAETIRQSKTNSVSFVPNYNWYYDNKDGGHRYCHNCGEFFYWPTKNDGSTGPGELFWTDENNYTKLIGEYASLEGAKLKMTDLYREISEEGW